MKPTMDMELEKEPKSERGRARKANQFVAGPLGGERKRKDIRE